MASGFFQLKQHLLTGFLSAPRFTRPTPAQLTRPSLLICKEIQRNRPHTLIKRKGTVPITHDTEFTAQHALDFVNRQMFGQQRPAQQAATSDK